MTDYSSMTITELREEAKKQGLSRISALKKQELLDLLLENEQKKEKAATPSQPVENKTEAVEKKTQSSFTGKKEGNEREEHRPQNKEFIRKPYNSNYQQNSRNPEDRRPNPEDRRPNSEDRRPNSYHRSNNFEQRPQNTGNQVSQQRLQDAGTPVTQQRLLDAGTPVSQQRPQSEENQSLEQRPQMMETDKLSAADFKRLDSGEIREGILEMVPENSYGFIRCDNFLPGDDDIYVAASQIRKFGLKTGDIICGVPKIRLANEKFRSLLYITKINNRQPSEIIGRSRFEDLTPIFPNQRLHLETKECSLSMRMVDLISPIGKGQRGMIVSQPKAGKTTLLKQIAKAITVNHPEVHLIILLIDERPEEVTDIKESINEKQVEVIYSTFDEQPERHKRVSEMVIEHAKRLVEQKEDVVILLDSITRLARAYNLTVAPSGRTLSGGLDPAALYMPKKFFGAARNMREGGSLTILATALVDTGSRMDDVVFEEFKGTGNMELVLDRNLSERRVFPAIDLMKSSTRREDLLLSAGEQEAVNTMRRMFNGARPEDSLENIQRTFQSTKNNAEFCEMLKKVSR